MIENSPQPDSPRHAAPPEQGAVMLVVVLLMFVFLGFATAFMDLGLVRMTQAQMQAAVDSAAVEGLRFRDHPVIDGRVAARDLVDQIFDDDFGTSSVEHTLGAGPVTELSGGFGATANALQTIESTSNYVPHLQLNRRNARHGDLVTGTYLGDALVHEENSVYERSDFVPLAQPEFPPDAFLVRLRRTNDFQGFDRLEGVSSAGPALPFLFGRAMAMSGNGSYEPRHHGLTVRAAAIASALPAIQGVLQFAIRRGAADEQAGWDALPPGEYTLRSRDDQLTLLFEEQEVAIGRFVRWPDRPVELGAQVPPAEKTLLVRPVVGYVPIFEAVFEVDRVIGFGAVEIRDIGRESATLVKRTGRIASENGSATTPGSLVNQVFLTLDPLERRAVLEAHGHFSDPLLAPALVR